LRIFLYCFVCQYQSVIGCESRLRNDLWIVLGGVLQLQLSCWQHIPASSALAVAVERAKDDGHKSIPVDWLRQTVLATYVCS